jgi:hypothetical protein
MCFPAPFREKRAHRSLPVSNWDSENLEASEVWCGRRDLKPLPVLIRRNLLKNKEGRNVKYGRYAPVGHVLVSNISKTPRYLSSAPESLDPETCRRREIFAERLDFFLQGYPVNRCSLRVANVEVLVDIHDCPPMTIPLNYVAFGGNRYTAIDIC